MEHMELKIGGMNCQGKRYYRALGEHPIILLSLQSAKITANEKDGGRPSRQTADRQVKNKNIFIICKINRSGIIFWRGPACQHLQRSNGGQVARMTLFFCCYTKNLGT